jgi:hypothetical protein
MTHDKFPSMSDKANAAFEQAATKIVERAKQTGTPVVVWEDDHVSELSPEHLTENRTPKTENHDG